MNIILIICYRLLHVLKKLFGLPMDNIQNCHHLLKMHKEVFWWFFKWLHSIKWGRIAVQMWFRIFHPTPKKKSYSPISGDFHFSFIRSDIDIRKMKIVWNWTVTFFFGVGWKIWNHFWKVIRPHFIDCNHLKNHQSTSLCILGTWWQFWILPIGYSDCQWTIFGIVTLCSKYRKVWSDSFLVGYNR